jgi:polyphosphate glucokinase
VLGGGHVHKLTMLPPRCRAGDNNDAFRGGFRLWEQTTVSRVPRFVPKDGPE